MEGRAEPVTEIDPLQAFGLLRGQDLEGPAPAEGLGQDQGAIQTPPGSGDLIEGRFRLLSSLGRGGMGSVFLAQDEELERQVAVKVLALAGDRARRRFAREAELTAQLDHPHVIKIHGSGQLRGHPYLVYELIEGAQTLDQAFAARDLPGRLELVDQVAAGLGAAHAQGIVHRDLKPENVLVRPSGEAVVLDFGLARVGGSSLTKTGEVMGTPAYMAPEQVRGEEATPRCDVWALGILLYEALYERHPFLSGEGGGLLELMSRIYEARVPYASGPPKPLLRLLPQLLAADPARRLPDAEAFRAALRAARDVPERRFAPLLIGLGALSTLALGGALLARAAPPSAASPGARLTAESPSPKAQRSRRAAGPLRIPHEERDPKDVAFLGEEVVVFGRRATLRFDARGALLGSTRPPLIFIRAGRGSLWAHDDSRTLRWDAGQAQPREVLPVVACDVDALQGDCLVSSPRSLQIYAEGGELLVERPFPDDLRGPRAILLPRRILVSGRRLSAAPSGQEAPTQLFTVPRSGPGELELCLDIAVRRPTVSATAPAARWVAIAGSDGVVMVADSGEVFQPLTRDRSADERPFARFAIQAHLHSVESLALFEGKLLSFAPAERGRGELELWSCETRRPLVLLERCDLSAVAISQRGRLALARSRELILLPLADLSDALPEFR